AVDEGLADIVLPEADAAGLALDHDLAQAGDGGGVLGRRRLGVRVADRHLDGFVDRVGKGVASGDGEAAVTARDDAGGGAAVAPEDGGGDRAAAIDRVGGGEGGDLAAEGGSGRGAEVDAAGRQRGQGDFQRALGEGADGVVAGGGEVALGDVVAARGAAA